MYLLYADESGSTHDARQQYFVLAGFCAFERQGYWLANELDRIAAQFNPADPSAVELHGSPMISGRGGPGDIIRKRTGKKPSKMSSMYFCTPTRATAFSRA